MSEAGQREGSDRVGSGLYPYKHELKQPIAVQNLICMIFTTTLFFGLAARHAGL